MWMQQVLEKKSDGFYEVLEINVTFVVNFEADRNCFRNKALNGRYMMEHYPMPCITHFFLTWRLPGFGNRLFKYRDKVKIINSYKASTFIQKNNFMHKCIYREVFRVKPTVFWIVNTKTKKRDLL